MPTDKRYVLVGLASLAAAGVAIGILARNRPQGPAPSAEVHRRPPLKAQGEARQQDTSRAEQAGQEAAEAPLSASAEDISASSTSAAPFSSAHADAAKAAYLEALHLEKAGRLAEAEEAYKKVVQEYAGTTAAPLTTLSQLAGVLAMQGKADEAYATYIRYEFENLKRAKETLPTEGPELYAIHAKARFQTARACPEGSRRHLDSLKAAKAQYEKVLRDFPESALASEASREVEWLSREIRREAERETARQAIARVVASFEKAIENKDADAVIALLVPSADWENLRTELDLLFSSLEYRPYKYEINTTEFSDGLLEATVNAKATPVGFPDKKPRLKRFFFVRIGDAWKLKGL